MRPAGPADVPALTELARAAKALWGYAPAWLDRWRPQLTLTEDDIGRMTVLVAESDDRVVGFGAIDRVGEEWEVAHLWVSPAFTRRGVGRALLGQLAECARRQGARRLRIESDPHAAPFYESAGAVRAGAVPAPMPGAPERELPILELSLDPLR